MPGTVARERRRAGGTMARALPVSPGMTGTGAPPWASKKGGPPWRRGNAWRRRTLEMGNKEAIMNARTLIFGAILASAVGGCATWDGMSSRERSAVIGAGVGGVAGAAATDGGVLGTVGGAAIGGVIGDQVGKRRE